MKVAHFAVFGPHQCGLYHTAKDLVMAERLVGIDAQLIDPDSDEIRTDGSLTTKERKWAYGADVLVRHTHIPTHLQNSGIPCVMALHGRPESSYLLAEKGNDVIVGLANKAEDARYKAFVTFWEEYVPFWSDLLPNVHYVPAAVDLDEFQPVDKPDSPVNLLICDIWREDVTPFNSMLAALRYARKYGAKVNIAALPSSQALRRILMPYRDVLGMVSGLTKDIKKFYDASHILVTPHVIATRSVREALACGLDVIDGVHVNHMNVNQVVNVIGDANIDPQGCREIAEEMFSFQETGRAMKSVLESVLRQPPEQRKVLIDIGAHLGETVRRFYREVPDADQYEIYCFEPDLETFEKLDRVVGHIPNVTLINAAAGTYDGFVPFYAGHANQNEGGTIMAGKLTGSVGYDSPSQVECIDFVRWFDANRGDYNIVKMNIEGGEYDLMKYMLDKDMTDQIDQLYVQLHAHKFQHGKQRQRMQYIEGLFYNKAKCRCYFTNKGLCRFRPGVEKND